MAAPFWLVMGVSGSGKSTVARALAEHLGGAFIEGDDYHPRRNIELMSQGKALADADRWPWLAAVAEAATRVDTRPVVIACSALKRGYRDLLRERLPGLRVLFLQAGPDLLHARLDARRDHFMKAGLLRSQFADLEPPVGEAGVDVLDVSRPLPAVVEAALRIAG
ncbi:gluconokinase [Ramlibacter sp. AW1]|uniref:Gluconokinase n=1 Tax=Ramlibacter aurantiacus TaxID=2801330 RepID=A0A937D653_9BURK|nr:gluconokinase [Ramlibacter aurantiacus]MBL0421987.1 gluconokinase [Ramlibacter aurantiacus]